MKADFMYDSEADSLLVYRQQKKSSLSVDLGDIIIDLDDNLSIVAIEVLNPDKVFKISKKVLESIVSADIQVNSRHPVIWIYITLGFKNMPEMRLPIGVPMEKQLTV
ncbi:DUF2283 domain-containing protein [archaeon]|nr:DUF2283 domain-containing protein [archaeon]